MILASVVGVLVTNPSINLPAFTGFYVEGTGNMFPILFVTIACGAVSGFHSLVSSGTSSKQIKSEKHMLPVSFGAMLMESMLAVIALIAVASFATGAAAEAGYTTPAQIFAGGDIILQKGIQGGGKGRVSARGNIFSDFIEYADIEAGMDVYANSIINSNSKFSLLYFSNGNCFIFETILSDSK